MSQQIRCPHCQQAYELTDEQVPQYAGQTITCTKCQQSFTVPPDIAAPPAPARPTPIDTLGQSEAAPRMESTTPPAPSDYGATYPYSGRFVPPLETSGFAVAALVLGILGLFVPLLPGILAVVFGILALKSMKDPRIAGKRLAISGIVIGALALLMNMCLISIFIPAFRSAVFVANRQGCQNNLRQIGQAMRLYANEYGGAYPDKVEKLLTYEDITAEAFVCPATGDTPAPVGTGATFAAASSLTSGGHLSFVYIGAGLTNSAPANSVLAYEPMTNHREGANFLWGDGHVSWEEKTEAEKLIRQLGQHNNPPNR